MPINQNITVGPHFNQRLVCSSVLQPLYLIDSNWKYASSRKVYCILQRLSRNLIFPSRRGPNQICPISDLVEPSGIVCVSVCVWGGDITELKAPFAKSPPPSPLPSLSSSSSCTWWGYKVQRWVLEEGTQCQIFANPDKTLAPKVPRQHRRENFSPSFPFPDAFHSPKCPCL